MADEKVSESETRDLGGRDWCGRDFCGGIFIPWVDARQHRRTNGERASADGGCRCAGADLRRKIPTSDRRRDKIDRVQKGVLVGPALVHREGRLGDNGGNRCQTPRLLALAPNDSAALSRC